jgi:hypothetical protein
LVAASDEQIDTSTRPGCLWSQREGFVRLLRRDFPAGLSSSGPPNILLDEGVCFSQVTHRTGGPPVPNFDVPHGRRRWVDDPET